MEKLYQLKGNFAEIILESNVYPLIVVEKTISNFMEEIFAKIEINEEKIYVYMILQKDKIELEKVIGEFYNELLREKLRYHMSIETSHLRELIVGRALYTTCIDLQEDDEEIVQKEEQEDYRIDDIAVNWFENHGNKEDKLC